MFFRRSLLLRVQENMAQRSPGHQEPRMDIWYLSLYRGYINIIYILLGRISYDRQILLKEIVASALIIFFDRDSIFLTILLMVGGSWKIT
jgi:hypothetical protein